jgi:hypothetical protein
LHWLIAVQTGGSKKSLFYFFVVEMDLAYNAKLVHEAAAPRPDLVNT